MGENRWCDDVTDEWTDERMTALVNRLITCPGETGGGE